MIERCPHCGKDVVFSKNICPECGLVSAEDERTELTGLAQERATSRHPTYTGPLEDMLSASQARGRLLVALAMGFLLTPDTAFFLVKLCWLRFEFLALIRLIALAWLLRRVWDGALWASRLAAVVAAVVGVSGVLVGIVRVRTLAPPLVLLFCIFGPLFVISAYTLTYSPDAQDFLHRQRRYAKRW